ncbi:MAG TPA: heavy metal-binding domain-containing protein [Vicinamibacterales bacterium]|nr:heavy metal-binding domain-containing protein [Vicinamibacterales bacterium]
MLAERALDTGWTGGSRRLRALFPPIRATGGRAGVVAAAATLAIFLLGARFDATGTAAGASHASQTVYTCPMHPDVRAAEPGVCTRCGMTLTPLDPFETAAYQLELTTAPHPPVARRPLRLRLLVRDQRTGRIVREFAVVHERPFHLFVLSQDLEHYAHVHPAQQPDGSFTIDITLPRPGHYKIYADFLPAGGTPQVIPRSLATADGNGDLAGAAASLEPDPVTITGSRRTLRKTIDGMAVELELPPDGLVAGREEKFTYRLADATTGAPIVDLEPYLGAWGHSLIVSEDTLSLVHAHPLELLPEDDQSARGGPTLTFKALLPKPGRYRIWTQVKRRGEVSTVMFTVAVASSATM